MCVWCFQDHARGVRGLCSLSLGKAFQSGAGRVSLLGDERRGREAQAEGTAQARAWRHGEAVPGLERRTGQPTPWS